MQFLVEKMMGKLEQLERTTFKGYGSGIKMNMGSGKNVLSQRKCLLAKAQFNQELGMMMQVTREGEGMGGIEGA